jgi:adenine-specific DNA-methyltransferase
MPKSPAKKSKPAAQVASKDRSVGKAKAAKSAKSSIGTAAKSTLGKRAGKKSSKSNRVTAPNARGKSGKVSSNKAERVRKDDKAGISELASSPGGAGMYLHWEGRRGYRTRMPAPRVLEPVDELSLGDTGGNRLIEGDNLQVMISLRSQYRGAVDAAYLDPPYNTGKKDFRYSDRRFRDPNANSDDAVYVSNEDGGRHTKWLNFMGPRLYLTWELLADHGVCFVSISDIELFRLGLLMDEIFGESNRLGVVVWRQMADNNPTRIAVGHEYILCYAKNIDNVPPVWTGHSGAKDWMLQTYERLKGETKDLGELQKSFRKAIKEHVAAYHRSLETGQDVGLVDLGELDRYKFVDDRGP